MIVTRLIESIKVAIRTKRYNMRIMIKEKEIKNRIEIVDTKFMLLHFPTYLTLFPFDCTYSKHFILCVRYKKQIRIRIVDSTQIRD